MDHSFFDSFFDDTPRYECNECGSKTDDLSRLGSATGGAQLWICKSCKSKREKESEARIAQAHANVEWSEQFDQYEGK